MSSEAEAPAKRYVMDDEGCVPVPSRLDTRQKRGHRPIARFIILLNSVWIGIESTINESALLINAASRLLGGNFRVEPG